MRHPLVFLDIDGVLNSKSWFKKHPTPGKWDLQPELVERVNRLQEICNASAVISSSWRLHMKPVHLETLLIKQGLTIPIVGMTPYLPERNLFWRDVPRGAEIIEWLNRNRQWRLETYAIIDDKDDMLPFDETFLVQTSPEIGMSEADVERAISILEK